MTDKVKLPKEIDKAINTCRMADISDYGIICMTHSSAGFHMTPATEKAIKTLRSFTFSGMEDEDVEWKVSAHHGPSGADKLLNALVNGYEVEQIPEDKVREMYLNRKVMGYTERATGIYEALHALGIKIKGVNA